MVAEQSEPASLLDKLYSYGSGAPGALAPRKRPPPGAAKHNSLLPLPPAARARGPPLRTGLGQGAVVLAGRPQSQQRQQHHTPGNERDSDNQLVAPGSVSSSPMEEEAAAPSSAALREGGGAGASSGTDSGAVQEPDWFIEQLRTEAHAHEFAYMKPADHGDGAFDPYRLRIVPFSQVDPADYYTISVAGVMRCKRVKGVETSDFTPLAQWEAERAQFRALMQIPFFKRYPAWKAHRGWRRGIVRKNRSACRGAIEARLLPLDPVFGPPLGRVRRLCVEASSLRLHRIERGEAYGLASFLAAQAEHREGACERLEGFFEAVRQAAAAACASALVRFEESSGSGEGDAVPSSPSMAGARASEPAPAADGGVKRSFLQQAQLRAVCERIRAFLRLVDSMILATAHGLIMSSLSELRALFEDTPKGHLSGAAAEASGAGAAETVGGGEGKRPSGLAPLFEVGIYFDTDDIAFEPSRAELARAIDTTMIDYVSMLKTRIGSVLADAAFHKYTAPVINGRRDNPEPVEGLDIVALVEENEEHNAVVKAVRASFEGHFDEVLAYCELLQPHRATYLANRAVDTRVVADTLALDEWRELLERFEGQRRAFEAIETHATVGIFAGNASRLKEIFLPSPQRCLDELHAALPELAARRTAALLEETGHATSVLSGQPEGVTEFVAFSEFLAKTTGMQSELAERGKTIEDMYHLMAAFGVQARSDDVASVKMLGSQLTALSALVDDVAAGQEERTAHFAESIEASIGALRTRATEVLASSKDSRLTDGDTELADAIDLVAGLDEQLHEVKAESVRLAEYQEVLKRPVTRYDEVEDLEAAMRLKRNLWHGIHDWGAQVDEWNGAPFDALDPELMQKEVTKYAKTVSQCEKGLAPNTALPILKERVETFKGMVPVVVSMRNEALKEHHWKQIEEAIGSAIERGEGFTLGYLLELRVSEFKDAIEAVSTAATQEKILEELLAKVEGMWKSLEFAVNSYKEQKDVFILGGVDDVLAVLEETQVLVQTILGSRFIGPLQKRVDDWDKKLRLFSETLDEWLAVQRSWMYLESIFKAQDIQRQLPNEYKQFDQVNKHWLALMRKTNADATALKCATAPKLLEKLQSSNATLDKIQKNLEDYLEMKRAAFPRFFFLSNDELLEILAQARDPQAVQPHLIKCFDNIKKLDFGSSPTSVDISGMYSQEGERVGLGKNLKARGTVEQWLGYVEEAMVKSLRAEMKQGLLDYQGQERLAWAKSHIAQVVLTVAMMYWCKEVEEVLDAEGDTVGGLGVYLTKAKQQLEDLARAVGGKLTGLERKALVALITGDVHNRDIVTTMIKERVDSRSSFTWAMQLRFYWEQDVDDTVVRQVNTRTLYGYEYQGALSRLVVTPLTDRCWMTLTGALHVGLGGAPAGPAGTGKTESVKDLAKGIGRQCVVFNCSDQLDYKMMGKLFSGVAQTGCWTCLDEFNRIDIEVLSVVAQQLLTIRQALTAKADHFVFEGREIRLKPTEGVFITMNPGYAGRTELPDNLKALFRPVSMMVPDYALIAEIMLYAEGFLDARSLAQKMVKMYKLCSEQLSQQDHYDYGMRQVKSVLVMSGSVKRGNPDLSEDVCLIRAMQEANVPRFLAQDLPLFEGIIGDLYPSLVIPPVDYGQLQSAAQDACVRAGLQVVDRFVTKVIELFQTFNVRFGVMTVGPTGGGKTSCMKMLQSAMSELHSQGTDDPRFQPVEPRANASSATTRPPPFTSRDGNR